MTLGKYRVGYYLSDGGIFAAGEDVAADAYDSSLTGTSVEFDAPIPEDILNSTYDDDSSGQINVHLDKGNWIDIETTLTDADGDGYVEMAADGSTTTTLTLQKKNAAGGDLGVGTNNYFLSIEGGGSLSKDSGSLSGGDDTVILEGSLNVGMLVTIKVWCAGAWPQGSELKVKFVD